MNDFIEGRPFREFTCEDIRSQIDHFLTKPMAESLRGVDYRAVEYGSPAVAMSDAAQAQVSVAHVLGSPEANYLLQAFKQELRMQIQLNVYRLVIVYKIPQIGSLDSEALQPRFARWELGANHAGWRIGWRDAVDVDQGDKRTTEIFCYAMLSHDFLVSERHQLYWMNDVVQMTRALFVEARRIDVRLS